MAQRYRQEPVQSGDVLDPVIWNENHAEFAAEFNNALDRDNLPVASITEEMIVPRNFNRIDSDGFSTSGGVNVFVSDMSRADWQRTDGFGLRIAEFEFEADVDSLTISEFGCNHLWTDWATLSGTPPEDQARFRIVMDGIPVAETGWYSSNRERESVYLVGAVPIVAGRHTAWVEVQVADIDPDDPRMQILKQADSGLVLHVHDRELVVHRRLR
jgi:hypothetical protein